jgi:hypothetical protein
MDDDGDGGGEEEKWEEGVSTENNNLCMFWEKLCRTVLEVCICTWVRLCVCVCVCVIYKQQQWIIPATLTTNNG